MLGGRPGPISPKAIWPQLQKGKLTAAMGTIKVGAAGGLLHTLSMP
jgi:hypothetical protein